VPADAVLVRLDGDAFGIVLRHADGLRAHTVAREIVDPLGEPLTTSAGPIEIAVTVGIACAPEHGSEADVLLRRADIALDLARAAGSRSAMYVPERDAYRADRRRLVAELRRAIDAGELELHYQPILSMSDRRVSAVEALVRWHHPTRGMVPPADFIDLAERSGVIRPLTRWVIRRALAEVRDLGRPDLQVSVNVSTHNLLDADLPAFVAGELPSDPGWPSLRLEVTESALMADPVRAAVVLHQLRALGVSVAIDDFGTGYSSLAYLERLPVDEIKIDRSFVRTIVERSGSNAIVRATLELAHALHLKVVGEGVEDERAWLMLKELGCEFAQGHLMAEPMPIGQLAEWLAASS
jgi:predicted signal transduction protein with EAL and GGDEF domain